VGLLFVENCAILLRKFDILGGIGIAGTPQYIIDFRINVNPTLVNSLMGRLVIRVYIIVQLISNEYKIKSNNHNVKTYINNAMT